jgi:hypothetical protein
MEWRFALVCSCLLLAHCSSNGGELPDVSSEGDTATPTVAVPTASCTPACSGKTCGSADGCGGQCCPEMGCYADEETRDLPYSAMSGSISVESCVNACREAGYKFAGAEFGSQCFCGDSYGKYGVSTNCNMACSADSGETCGGRWASDVYRVGDAPGLGTGHVMMGVVSDMAPLGPESAAGTFENMVGRRMTINGAHYYAWGDTMFPGGGEANDAETGTASMITWMEENESSDGTISAVDVDSIASGSQDSLIAAAAARFNVFSAAHPGHKIYLRIFHEMNGEWEPWNAFGSHAIVDAWQHIHQRFAVAGVKNVYWVFCPNASDIPSTSANRFYDYYPGSSYVDVVGDDVYPGTGNSFSSAVGYVYDYNHVTAGWQKPVLIAETAITNGNAAYLQQMDGDIKSLWPDIMGVVWFNRDYASSSDPSGANLTVSQSSAFLAQYKLFLQDPYFELYSE